MVVCPHGVLDTGVTQRCTPQMPTAVLNVQFSDPVSTRKLEIGLSNV